MHWLRRMLTEINDLQSPVTGPRCAIAAVIARSEAIIFSATGGLDETSPAIPHMVIY
jgi:hypothetical protein